MKTSPSVPPNRAVVLSPSPKRSLVLRHGALPAPVLLPPGTRTIIIRHMRRRRRRIGWRALLICLLVIAIVLLLPSVFASFSRTTDAPQHTASGPSSTQIQVPQASSKEKIVPEKSLYVPGTLVRELRRIAQMNPAEYDSNEERSWAASACSAAAMTVVMNGYTPDPYRYRVVDILREEIRVGAISQAQGLLSGLSGIKETVHAFGFDAKAAPSTSVEEVIALANTGVPLIVSFPPQRAWPTGHLLVLTGGNENSVFLLDSSEFNLGKISRSKFEEYWAPRHFAVQLIPRVSRVLGKPSLSVQFMDRVLREASSPAHGKAQTLYDLGVEYGIDPAFALAFFEHESRFGTQGVARTTRSLSNMRCVPQYECHEENGGYARFKSWEEGFRAWYVLIGDLYIKTWKRVTVEQIIPKYAPQSDNNNETAYIQSVLSSLQKWRQQANS